MASGVPALTFAGVATATIEVVRRHFAAFATLAAAFAFLPQVAMRLLLPDLATAPQPPGAPPQLPPGLLPSIIVVSLLQFAGLFAIAAVAADPAEGGDRPLAGTLGDALPAFGKFLLALLLFAFGYLLVSIVVGIIVAVLATIVGVATGGGAMSPQSAMATSASIAQFIVAIILPVLVWLMARLSPLTGIFLRETTGVVDGIKRAWAMSKGSTWPILRLLLVFVLGSVLIASLQFAVMRLGVPRDGIGGIVSTLVFAAIGAWLFVYSAAGTGMIYRQLRAAEK